LLEMAIYQQSACGAIGGGLSLRAVEIEAVVHGS
jgi:hypothetical protein